MTILLIKAAAGAIVGVIAGFAAVYIFNKMPASWLCDYDEKPSRELIDPYVQRVKGMPWRWIYAAGFVCLILKLIFFDMQYTVAALFACWALLIIGLADLKYMIIPDQFVIMLALTAFGFIPYHDNMLQPLLGMAIGGGAMLTVLMLGGAAFKKDVMGFGDVKLFASAGLVLGIKGVIIVLVGSSIFSGIAAAAELASGKCKGDDLKPLGPYICGWGIFYIFIIWPFLM